MSTPILVSTSPLDDATGVAVGTNIVLTFDQPVQAGPGNIEIRPIGGGMSWIIPVPDVNQVSFAGNQLIINPSVDLAENHAYYIAVTPDAVRDLDNNSFAGISSPTTLNFTTAGSADTTGPALIGTSPLDDATGVNVGANIVLTFDEPIQASTGSITIRHAVGGQVAQTILASDASQVSVSGNQLIINPTNDLLENHAYYITFTATTVRDLANNVSSGLSSTTAFNFTTAGAADTTGPVVTGTSPLHDATGVNVGTNIVLTFDEPIQAGTGQILILHSPGGLIAKTISVTDASQVSISGNQLTINPSSDLLENHAYYIRLMPDAVRDLANNATGGFGSSTTFNFTTAGTADTTAPIITGLSPFDNATGVPADTDLVLTFNEDVGRGDPFAAITIFDPPNGFSWSIQFLSNAITFSGNQVTVDLPDLIPGRSYFVTIQQGGIVDLAGNAFGGISSSQTFNFSTALDLTAPSLVGTLPVDDETGVDAGSPLILMFNEFIEIGTGNIEIRNASDGSIAQTIAVTDVDQVYTNAGWLTITPSTDLTPGASYYVLVDPGAVLDPYNNPFAGISRSRPTRFSRTTTSTATTSPTSYGRTTMAGRQYG